MWKLNIEFRTKNGEILNSSQSCIDCFNDCKLYKINAICIEWAFYTKDNITAIVNIYFVNNTIEVVEKCCWFDFDYFIENDTLVIVVDL